MKKLVLSLLAALALCLGMLPVTALAEEPEGVWTDYAASGFAGGTGTEADPYQIATAEQLAKLSKDVGEGTSYQGTFFVLTENIDLSAHRWTPIGIYKWTDGGTTTNNSFQGFLDGNDKTISGMYVDERIDHYCGGLFGKINIQRNGSPVGAKDLTITGATVYIDETGLTECSGAILAGNVMGSDTQSVEFENITVSGSVYVTRTNGHNNIGGMLGYASWVNATNCHADGVSISGASNCGGFVGNDSGSFYENCTASGTIDGAWVVGGFVGYSASAIWQDPAGASAYTKCAADVDVSGNDWELGGFVGLAGYGEFYNCVAYGDVKSSVTGGDPKVGGFMGEDGSDVSTTACHAAGTVTSASSDYQAGGFVGTYSGGTFTGCSYDNEKNPNLNPAGSGTIASGLTGEKSAVVLSNICEDYYGGHQYSTEWAVETAATCTEAGSKYHPCERCGAKGETAEIPATGHKYGEPVWSWSEDGKSCTATFICENDAAHWETPAVTITSEVKTPATSTQNGVTEYTATTTFEGETYTATKNVADIPATGGGLTTYAITVPADVDGGTVKVSSTRASSGTTVTITVTPNAGYVLDGLTVTDASGNAVSLTDKGDGKYSFTMPGSNVTVEAGFAPVKPDYTACDGGEGCPLSAFADLDGSAWYHDGVHYCLDEGLMGGYGDGLFGPDDDLSRAQLCQVLYNREGRPAVASSGTFDDVAEDAWYFDAVSWAEASGVVEGYGDGSFGPDDPVTREQLAAILYRYAKLKGCDVGAYEDTDILGFSDASEVSDWALVFVRWVSGTGIIEGVDGTLIPQGHAIRAQAATMLMRYCNYVESE